MKRLFSTLLALSLFSVILSASNYPTVRIACIGGDSYSNALGNLLGNGYEVRGFKADECSAAEKWLPDAVTLMLDDERGYMGLVREFKSIDSHPKVIIVTSSASPSVSNIAKWNGLELISLSASADSPEKIAAVMADAMQSFGIAPGPRVMFVGDSITDGFWGRKDSSPSSERDHYDKNHVYGHGYQAVTSGKLLAEYPEKNIRCYNRGWGGNKLSDIIARWDNEVLSVRPSVISLLVGVNDTNSGTVQPDPAKWEADYRALIDHTLKELPDVKFVLCTPFFSPDCGYQSDGHAEYIRPLAEAVRRIASDYGFVCVDFAELVDGLLSKPGTLDRHYWLWDGIHPSYATHEKMSELWLKKVGKRVYK